MIIAMLRCSARAARYAAESARCAPLCDTRYALLMAICCYVYMLFMSDDAERFTREMRGWLAALRYLTDYDYDMR